MVDERDYDDRDGFIWLDGALVPWREANVHVLTHALHYASSVFEGQRAYGGEIFRLTDHSKRLKRSGEILGFDIPWTVEQIDEACREVLRANNLEDAYVRPVAWRVGADGRFGPEVEDPPRHRRLVLGRLFRRGGDPQGAEGRHLALASAGALYRADRVQGVGPLHDLHHGPAPGAGARL